MIGELRKMGYTEVNLNFGCPSGTVTAKGKGAGMLRDLSKLEAFLDEVFSQAEGPISVKTRLGVTSPEEFEAILDLYDRCPICELTIHPRVMRQLYRGEADRAAFANYLPHCRMPVCYNGDITTPAQLKALEAEFPNLSGIMVGRGIIADPALLRQAVGGAPASKEELRGYLDELYHGYTGAFGMASCAVSRMKAHWHYLIQRFEGSEAFLNSATGAVFDHAPIALAAPAATAAADDTAADKVWNRTRIQNTMWHGVGVLRDEAGLKTAIAELGQGLAAANAQADVNADGAASSVEALENRNMLTVGYVAATAALARTESRGAHARTDHSEPVDNWAHSVAYIKD